VLTRAARPEMVKRDRMHGPCICRRDGEHDGDLHSGLARAVSRPFPSWNRSTLTEIYLCHACSDHEIEDGNGPDRFPEGTWVAGACGVTPRVHSY
jgi:hypothetical protein